MAMQSGFIKRIRDIMRMDAGINGDAQRIEQMVWMLFLKVYDAKEDDWELNEDNYESIIPEGLRWRNWAKSDSNGHAMTGDKLLNFVNNSLFPVLKGNDVKEGDTIVYEGIKVTPDTPIKKAIVISTFEDANNYMKDGVYLRQVIDVIDEIEFDDVKESHAFGFVYEEILRELQSAGSSGEFYTPRAVTEFMALMIKPQLGEIRLQKLTARDIQQYYTWLMDEKKLSPNTVIKHHNLLTNTLNAAERQEYITKNPMRAVSPPKKRQREAKFYTPEQLGILLDKAVGTRLELPVFICAYLGLRRGELCGLRWSDVDLEHQTITIENTRTQAGKRKSRKARKRRPLRARCTCRIHCAIC